MSSTCGRDPHHAPPASPPSFETGVKTSCRPAGAATTFGRVPGIRGIICANGGWSKRKRVTQTTCGGRLLAYVCVAGWAECLLYRSHPRGTDGAHHSRRRDDTDDRWQIADLWCGLALRRACWRGTLGADGAEGLPLSGGRKITLRRGRGRAVRPRAAPHARCRESRRPRAVAKCSRDWR